MNQELIDKMVGSCAALDPRDAVSVAFRNYERHIAAPLKSVLDREWKDNENLYTVSQITANAITWRDRRIAELEKDAMKPKTVVFDEASNTPCTAELEVKIQKLISYLEKRARENEKRAKREDEKLKTFHRVEDFLPTERSAYYFSGKADSYKRAADKLKKLLAEFTTPEENKAKPEEWIVEVCHSGVWSRSLDKLARDTYGSLKEAQEAVVAVEKRYSYTLSYRAVRKS